MDAIVLIGLPGSGKSTVGRVLARRLDLPFIDTDDVIEQRIGCSIRSFFEREGEAAFRDVEEQVLSDVADPSKPAVLATGGGAVLREANRIRLRQAGQVVYLASSPEEVHARLRHDSRRPLLQVDDPLARLRALYEARDPLYRQTAHIVVDIGRPSVSSLVKTIIAKLEQSGTPRG